MLANYTKATAESTIASDKSGVFKLGSSVELLSNATDRDDEPWQGATKACFQDEQIPIRKTLVY